jgi:uncharacterized membrane protein YeaQ/YmgE (transglycosylase-associated protein family)
MYAAEPEPARAFADQVIRLSQLGGVALLAGWLAERLIDTGFRLRGLAPLAGAVGFYAGSTLWATAGWPAGPLVWGLALVPAFAGALAICAILKLVSLGVAGPRW